MSEALRLADAIGSVWVAACIGNNDGYDAAAELRRLSAQVEALEAENAELREAVAMEENRYRRLRTETATKEQT